MNAAAWFAAQSFCGRPVVRIYYCTAEGQTGGSYMVSYSGRGAKENAESFRAEQESYGHKVTIKVQEVRL